MKKELWLRLKHYHFDNLVPAHLADHVAAAFGGADASTKAFASKLGRKLNWSTPFALRAIDEYKKFVYLGVVSDFPVTPPKVIDMVWHEHLLFSRAYRDFCANVLGRDFDHNPELVPTKDQTDVFQSQFMATLDFYNAEFHVDPPADIWGTPKFPRGATIDRARKPVKLKGDSTALASSSDAPLYTYFDGSDSGHAHHGMAEFGGGGGFSGAGGDSSWGGHGHGDAGGHGDGGSGDGGGGGDGGGSGCSSGCGGGGCGS